jgi:hypothetical protein
MIVGSDKNILKGLLYLYQSDKLLDYFDNNNNAVNIRKFVNPLNTSESYDMVGTIDAVFKVCTSELFELFKTLWCLKTGKHLNKGLYDMLPKEYKDLLFAIRGLYYKKKAVYYNKKETETVDIKSTHLRVSDIYNLLKSVSTDSVIAFIRMRRLMFNWLKIQPSLSDFGTSNKYCDKVHLKLIAIFTSKLFPDIMPNDIPPMKVAAQEVTI